MTNYTVHWAQETDREEPRAKTCMATADDFRTIALGLAGTIAAPHFDRTAFKVARTYATLAPDGLSFNIKLAPEEQEFKCAAAPEIFSAIPNAWGRQGWTRVELATIGLPELETILESAWRSAVPRRHSRRQR